MEEYTVNRDDDYDWDLQTYLELGGNIEDYDNNGLNNWWDS